MLCAQWKLQPIPDLMQSIVKVCSLLWQVGIDVMHLGRLHVRSETLSILVAAQCLLLWLKIQYFAR